MFKNKHINHPNLAKVLPVLCLALSIILSNYSKELIFPGKFIPNNKSFSWQLRVTMDALIVIQKPTCISIFNLLL